MLGQWWAAGAVNSEGRGGGFLLFPLADWGWVNNRLSLLGQMGLSQVPGILSTASVVIWRRTLTEKHSQTRTFTHLHTSTYFITSCKHFPPQLWSVVKPRAGDSGLTTSNMGLLCSRGKSHGISQRQSSCSRGRNRRSHWPNTVISTLQGTGSGLLFYLGMGLLGSYY